MIALCWITYCSIKPPGCSMQYGCSCTSATECSVATCTQWSVLDKRWLPWREWRHCNNNSCTLDPGCTRVQPPTVMVTLHIPSGVMAALVRMDYCIADVTCTVSCHKTKLLLQLLVLHRCSITRMHLLTTSVTEPPLQNVTGPPGSDCCCVMD